jgi:hypothetical protein
MFDVIERLKSEWTDKYVVINSSAPELARFARATGTVKTVNMNGRCLVEFDQFNNTGWYDIDPAALKIVTEPLPKPAEKEAAKPRGNCQTGRSGQARSRQTSGESWRRRQALDSRHSCRGAGQGGRRSGTGSGEARRGRQETCGPLPGCIRPGRRQALDRRDPCPGPCCQGRRRCSRSGSRG